MKTHTESEENYIKALYHLENIWKRCAHNEGSKDTTHFNDSIITSYRYERGVDPNTTINAHSYAVALLCELTGKKEFGGNGESFRRSRV